MVVTCIHSFTVLPHVVVAINQPDDDLMDDDIIALPNLDRPVSATAINAQLSIANH